MILVDSHCHLNRLDLTEFDQNLDLAVDKARNAGVRHMLGVCVALSEFPVLCALANQYTDLSISVGVHPDNEPEGKGDIEPNAARLIEMANSHPACIAIGETGLDYYRVESAEGKELQRSRFREHIRAAIATSKPLIIHTRQAADDTLDLMREEHAESIGGVMHCFTEDLSTALRAIELNFYISISGIVTFKNAAQVQEVARSIPLDRLLIETDAPYLAPVPYRGKPNHPALVREVALKIAELRGITPEELARRTTDNFQRCFRIQPDSLKRA